ncbi:MAG: SurA N-terminal domain-containing protein [Candidatus Omnitrophica bacterium]|nr:SurA N-terminal domain-containing protein [Candidatus Omnitrophota bacterium]
MKRYKFLSMIMVLGSLAGCCAHSDSGTCEKKSVVAKVNGYELTESDFLNEVTLISPKIYQSADKEKAKERALNELITKKVLLQEAQRSNFDKDRKFMREIERYWEQALLKLLMKKKIDEFSKAISPEVPFETRQQILRAEISKWIADVRNAAKIKIYKENLDKVEIKEGGLDGRE